MSTIVATFLARLRGSSEPDLSRDRARDFKAWIRDAEAVVQDHGWLVRVRSDQHPHSVRISCVDVYRFRPNDPLPVRKAGRTKTKKTNLPGTPSTSSSTISDFDSMR